LNPGEALARPEISVEFRPDETDAVHGRRPGQTSRPRAPTAAARARAIPPVFGAKPTTISCPVLEDSATEAASAAFEVNFDGFAKFALPAAPKLDNDWRVGLVYGHSAAR